MGLTDGRMAFKLIPATKPTNPIISVDYPEVGVPNSEIVTGSCERRPFFRVPDWLAALVVSKRSGARDEPERDEQGGHTKNSENSQTTLRGGFGEALG